MWSEITRPKYEREGQRYASDLTNAEWALIERSSRICRQLSVWANRARPSCGPCSMRSSISRGPAVSGGMLPKDSPSFTSNHPEREPNARLDHTSELLPAVSEARRHDRHGDAAMTESQEFSDIYKLDVIEIPTNEPCIRDDTDDEGLPRDAREIRRGRPSTCWSAKSASSRCWIG
jgi:hypothetical protein